MTKSQIIEKVKKGNYSKEQILTWLSLLPADAEKRKPAISKVGDVYTNQIFKHPYVLLERKGDKWLCGLLTSDEDFPDNLCECRSRFFEGKFFTTTLFIVSELKGTFLNQYDNNKHLKEVKNNLLSIVR